MTNVDKSTLLWRLVTAMAPLQPALVETDFGLVAGEVLRRERKRALVVLFTALEPGALGDGLLPVLPQLAAKHKIIVAAVHDPALSRMAQVRPDAGPDEEPDEAGAEDEDRAGLRDVLRGEVARHARSPDRRRPVVPPLPR